MSIITYNKALDLQLADLVSEYTGMDEQSSRRLISTASGIDAHTVNRDKDGFVCIGTEAFFQSRGDEKRKFCAQIIRELCRSKNVNGFYGYAIKRFREAENTHTWNLAELNKQGK